MATARKPSRRSKPKKPFNVRLSDEQRGEVASAAAIVSAERHEDVDQSTLFREVGLKGVREINARGAQTSTHPSPARRTA